jgi:nitrile hydratase
MADEREPHGHDQERVFQPDIEDLPASDYELTSHAVRELLIEKGVLTADEIRAQIEALDAIEPSLGGRIVARAWTDPGFRERLLENGTEAVKAFDIDMGDADLVVVENAPTHHNLIVCTLCSCYPRQVLGMPPDWYKSRNYRSRVVNEPRAVLREFGTEIPDQIAIRVHDSTADLRYMVLPVQPAGTEGWSAERLAAIITRDSLVGVIIPTVPQDG